ncbi:unnamed protein product, partial [Heterosigma akashiwo]
MNWPVALVALILIWGGFLESLCDGFHTFSPTKINQRPNPPLFSSSDAIETRNSAECPPLTVNVPPSVAYQACLDGWREGFGLPLLCFTLKPGDELSGEGFTCMRVPPFLVEEIKQVQLGKSMEYEVTNAGYLTYQVEPGSHKASILFEAGSGGETTTIRWSAKFKPLVGWEPFIAPLTNFIL